MPQAEPAPHRFTLDDVRRMDEIGMLEPDVRRELIDGVLYDMNPPGPAHAGTVSWLTQHLVRSCPDHEVRIQDALIVEGGWLSPDAMVLEPVPRDQLPETALLVVEVAVSSLRHDQAKIWRYARAGVLMHWLVEPAARTVLVHSAPEVDGYRCKQLLRDGDMIPGPVPEVSAAVTDLLGPPGRPADASR